MAETKKLIKLSLTALKSNFKELGQPYKMTFSITYWCQSRCLTCDIWQLRPKGELTLDDVQKFTMKNPYFKWIELTGGEPFMRSDVVEIARTFKEHMNDLYLLTMPTNSLCEKNMVLNKVRQILELKVPRFIMTLSLDGNRELHDKIRGVKGNFDKVMDMARGLHELQSTYKNLDFVFGYTMSKYNAGMLAKTIEDVKAELPFVTYNSFHVNMGQISDVYYKNTGLDFSITGNSASDEVKYLISKRHFSADPAQVIEGAFLKKLEKYIRTGKIPVRSRSLDASVFMDSYGNVYPSIMWDRKIGNIKETDYSLFPILHCSEANEVKRLIKEGKEPSAWTACEAYQALAGDIKTVIF